MARRPLGQRLAAAVAFASVAGFAGAAAAGPCDGAKNNRMVVKFEVGSTAISSEDRQRLKTWAAPYGDSRRICLLGQADKQGDELSNKRLALQRAEAVRRVLIGYGVPGKVIETHAQEKQFTLWGLLDEDQVNDRRVVVGHGGQ